jgi:hypothetical protein
MTVSTSFLKSTGMTSLQIFSGEIFGVTMNAAKSVMATFNLSLINGVCGTANGQANIARECLKLNRNK